MTALEIPHDVEAVFEAFRTCEFSTLARDGTPITWPVIPFYFPDENRFLVTAGIGLPQKALNARRNPRVSLFFSDPTGSGLDNPPTVLVQGDAKVPEKIVPSMAETVVNTTLIAGVLAGIAGLLTFLIIHQLWIMPIWFILPLGLVIAVVGGLAIGWAYGELLPNLPPRPWIFFALVALIWTILLPSVVIAELGQPLFIMTGDSAVLAVSIGRASIVFILELLVTTTLMGGLAGWLIGGTGRAALATAIAGFVFALGPGHNIPLIGGTPGVPKELAIMMSIIAVSALVLVEVQARLVGLNRASC